MFKFGITTLEERIEIVKFCILNDFDYLKTIEKYKISYTNLCEWMMRYERRGADGLVYRFGERSEKSIRLEIRRLRIEQWHIICENHRLKEEIYHLKEIKYSKVINRK
ncbi:hypothetical protein [Metaclostridioides mangenotii]|uniref:Transposase n=1 Tax=Metaclostridioides mangenotii TaxID=1540 RepID=A0ABS4E7N9_9FIRM|nr:hypothetical protein [Clostridioides mangenotii]MBP1853966.1 hypothetical protein [Clostridioides mangenotii]